MHLSDALQVRRLTGICLRFISKSGGLHSVSARCLMYLYSRRSKVEYSEISLNCIRGHSRLGLVYIHPLANSGFVVIDKKSNCRVTDRGRDLVKACIYEAEVKAGVRFSDLLEGFEY